MVFAFTQYQQDSSDVLSFRTQGKKEQKMKPRCVLLWIHLPADSESSTQLLDREKWIFFLNSKM